MARASERGSREAGIRPYPHANVLRDTLQGCKDAEALARLKWKD